jgi:hypothetical protein
MRQNALHCFLKCLFDHVTEMWIACQHRLHEFFGLIERNLRRQSWDLRIGNRFKNDRPRRTERLFLIRLIRKSFAELASSKQEAHSNIANECHAGWRQLRLVLVCLVNRFYARADTPQHRLIPM